MKNKHNNSKKRTKISFFYLIKQFPIQTFFHYLIGSLSAFSGVKVLGKVVKFINKDDSVNIGHLRANFWEIIGRLMIFYGIIVLVHIAFEIYLVEMYSSHLRQKLAKKYLKANFSQTQKEKFVLSNYQSNAVEVGTKTAQIFNRCFYSLVKIILLFWTLFKEEKGYLIPWILGALFILSVASLFLFWFAYRYRLQRTKSIQKENKRFEEIKNNMEYIKISGAEEQEIKKSKIFSTNNLKNIFALAFSKSLFATIPNYVMVEILPILFLILGGGREGIFLGALYWVMSDLFKSWKKFFEELWAKGGYDSYYSSLVQLNSAFAILEKDSSSPLKVNYFPTKKPNIIFHNVDFSYPETNKKLLDNFSFTFQNGKKYAIIGENGVGKSTLFKLIVKLYFPQKGNIKLGENDLGEIDNSALRKKIIYLPNHPFFFNTSLGDNIVYPEIYREDIHKKKLENIAKKLGIKEFIDKLPKRWETIIAEKGQNLSEGQKQLVSLMRVFIKDYKIYLFDEFLSNVSSNLKEKIVKVIFHELQDKTVIVISHDSEVLTSPYLEEIYFFSSHKLIKGQQHERK